MGKPHVTAIGEQVWRYKTLALNFRLGSVISTLATTVLVVTSVGHRFAKAYARSALLDLYPLTELNRETETRPAIALAQSAGNVPSGSNCPFSKCRTVLANFAACGSCVTITIVLPNSRFSRVSIVSTSSAEAASKLPVGSSARIKSGSVTMARAIATRCSWPPDSCLEDVRIGRQAQQALAPFPRV